MLVKWQNMMQEYNAYEPTVQVVHVGSKIGRRSTLYFHSSKSTLDILDVDARNCLHLPSQFLVMSQSAMNKGTVIIYDRGGAMQIGGGAKIFVQANGGGAKF